MRRTALKALSAIAIIFLTMSLTGCTLIFTLQGASSYTIMPDGRVLDGSLVEGEIEMELTTKGFTLKLPVAMELELEGLIMSMTMEPAEIDAALDTIGDYLETQIGFGSYSADPATDTFRVAVQYSLLDFWTVLGISSPGTLLGPYTVPLKLIIGQTSYDKVVDSIANIANTMIEDGSSIDFEFVGKLKTSTDVEVGTFILWFDTINPV